MAVEGGPIAEAAVELVAAFPGFRDDVRAKVRAAAADVGKEFDDAFTRSTRNTGRNATDRISRDLGDGGRRAGISWADAFRQAIAFRITSQTLRSVFAPLAGIGNLIGIATLGAGAAAATASLVQFVAVASQAAGVVLAIPSAVAIGAAAFLSLSVALHGVGDAFSAALTDDPRKFAEALEGLAPAAQNVARELDALRPELLEIRNATQQAFFGPIEGQLTRVANVLSGPMRAGMVGVAGASGQVARGLADIASQTASVQLVTQTFATTRTSIDNLRPGILAIVTGFRDLALVALPIFEQMSGSVGGLAVQFGQWLSEIAASGQAFEWIQRALTVLRQLGDVLVQVGGIIGAVFRAAQATGGGVIATFAELLRGVNEFLNSAEGQTALISVFQALAQVGAALSPIIRELFVQFGALAPIAAQIAVAMGPGLTVVIRTLGQALQGLGPGLVAVAEGLSEGLAAAGPGIVQLGEALGRLLEALAPILPLLGELVGVLAGAFAEAIVALIPVLTPLVQALVDGLGPILPQLAEAFTNLITALTPIMPLLGELLALAAQLAAAGLQVIFTIIAAAVNLLAAAINVLVAAGRLLWTHVLVPLGTFLAGVFQAAVTLVAGVFRVLAGAVSLVAAGARWLWNNVLVPFASFLAARFSVVVSGLKGIWDGLKAAFDAVGRAGTWLWDNVLAPLGRFLANVFGPVIDAIASAFRAIVGAVEAVINAIRSLISWIGDAISGLTDLISLGGDVIPIPRGGGGGGPGGRSAPPPGGRIAPTARGAFPVLRAMPTVPTRTVAAAPLARPWPAAPPVSGPSKTVHVNAPITVVTPAANPTIVARRASDRIAALAQA